MIAITPLAIDSTAVLVATTAVDEAAYSAGTTYAAGAVVSKDQRKYTSLQAANTGHDPATEVLWWDDSGPSNIWAMFDASAQTATTATDELTVTIASGRVPGVGLMGMIGQTLTLTVRDGLGGTVIYTETLTLQGSDGTYYSFCFDDLAQISDQAWTGLQGSINGHITISITGSGTVACGLCVLGATTDLGEAQFDASTAVENRGRDYLDALGNPVSIERGYSRTLSATLVHSPAQYNRLMAFYAANIGNTCFFVLAPGMADLVSAMTVGRISRVVPVIKGPTQHVTSIEISGAR